MPLYVGPDSRQCGECKEIKSYERFSPRDRSTTPWLYKSKCKDCCARQARGWYSQNTERGNTNRRRLWLLSEYGLTDIEHAQMLDDQEHKCAICRADETTVRQTGKVQSLSVDHCHSTGKVRGLLCNRCNRAIGLLNDDPEILKAALGYLLRYSDIADE